MRERRALLRAATVRERFITYRSLTVAARFGGCLQLRDQPRLAHARFADERHHLSAALGDGGDRRLQPGQLLLPANQLGPQPLDPPRLLRAWQGSRDGIGRHRLGQALDLQRAGEILESAPGLTIGPLADQELARLRLPLQPRGEADHRAGEADLLMPVRAARAEIDRAGIDPRGDFQRQAPRRLLDREGGPDRPLRVILVRLGRAEARQHSVTQEAIDLPPELPDRIRHDPQQAVHERRGLFRVQLLRRRDRAATIRRRGVGDVCPVRFSNAGARRRCSVGGSCAHAERGQTHCPFIKLHLIPPVLVVCIFVQV